MAPPPSSGREPHEVTVLLKAWRRGDARAGDDLLARIYEELRKIAAAKLRRERADHSLQTTALVHEAYVRLLDQRRVDWRDRAHFFGLAATMMRRVLVDHARAHNSQKRTGPEAVPPLTIESTRAPEVNLIDLDRSLTEFSGSYPRQAKVVELRYFADLDIEEVAVCLDVSPATVKRDWQFARAWLSARLGSGPDAGTTVQPA